MELTKQQEEAKNKILEWYQTCRATGKQTFTLAGYAGTGKTFLINNIIESLGLKPNEVGFGTPTGKAASVLIQRGTEAMTIHRMIYNAVDEEYEETISGKVLTSHRIKFVKKDSIPDYRLIVLDEISMVDEKMMKDLLSFGIPILCTGDPGQLPPIQGKNPLIENPDYYLTDIVRQSADNPIIRLATMARNKQYISYGNYGSVLVLDKRFITDEQMKTLLLKADQVICGTNATKNYLNNTIRKMSGIDVLEDKYPVEGDKVICTVNNWEKYLDENEIFNLVNGTIGYVKEFKLLDDKNNMGMISFEPDFLEGQITQELLIDSGVFINSEFSFDMHQRAYVLPDGKYGLKKMLERKKENESFESFRDRLKEYIVNSRSSLKEEQINRFEYGYAISCHKSQGSEFDKVVLFNEGYMFEESEKWLYTGITRAKKKLVIIR
jgi:exodeoxyribonuclease V